MEAGSPKRHKFTPDSGSFANNDESRVGDIILQSPSNYNVQDVSKIATPSDQQGDDVSSLIKRVCYECSHFLFVVDNSIDQRPRDATS
jgi:hypothetical protein